MEPALLSLRLREGKVSGSLAVSRTTGQPLAMLTPVCGDPEVAVYSSWGEIAPGVPFAMEVVTLATDGGRNVYTTEGSELRDLVAEALTKFHMPPPALLPEDTAYAGPLAEPGGSESLPFFLSRSNHILVRPSIDGEPIDGVMILDSGASGYVITRELADELGLEAFGELYVSGVTQKVRSQFRRSKTLSLGGVTQQCPLFMELPLDGVVNGAPDRVVGILGYDIFRRVVVEVPALRETPGLTAGAASSLSSPGGPPIRRVGVAAALGDGEEKELILHNPEAFQLPAGGRWMTTLLVSNVPHVKAKFYSADGQAFETILMLDSGAGGAGVLFHSRSTNELGLVEALCAEVPTINVRGVGGGSGEGGGAGGLEARRGTIARLELDCGKFFDVSSLVATRGGLDLSLHTSGMICVDLLLTCKVIFDYPRRRVSILQGPLASR